MSAASSLGRPTAGQRLDDGSRRALTPTIGTPLLLYKGIDFPHADALSVDPHS